MSQPTPDGSTDTFEGFLNIEHPDFPFVKDLIDAARSQGFDFELQEVPKVDNMDENELTLAGIRKTRSWTDRIIIDNLDRAAALRIFKPAFGGNVETPLRSLSNDRAFVILTQVLEWPAIPPANRVPSLAKIAHRTNSK